MKLEGTKQFDAPREVVWSVIDDPEKMAGTMPGVESFEIRDERHWSAKVKVPLGIGGLKMSISFEKLEGAGRRRTDEHDDVVHAQRER
jgi:carbon monoxide dehydrogenase subunit G